MSNNTKLEITIDAVLRPSTRRQKKVEGRADRRTIPTPYFFFPNLPRSNVCDKYPTDLCARIAVAT